MLELTEKSENQSYILKLITMIFKVLDKYREVCLRREIEENGYSMITLFS